MAPKNISISPLIQSYKKDNVRQFDSLNNLNKRIAVAIDKAVVQQFQTYAQNVTNKLTEVFFLGYYIDGGYVGVLGNELKFQSPIDKYQYKQIQVRYSWSQFSTRIADALNADGTPFVNGQDKVPLSFATSAGPGEIIFIEMYVNQDDGSVNIRTDYFQESSGTGTQTNDGILAVFAICSRALA